VSPVRNRSETCVPVRTRA